MGTAERLERGGSRAGFWGRHSNGAATTLVFLCFSFGLELLAHSSPHELLRLCNPASLKLQAL